MSPKIRIIAKLASAGLVLSGSLAFGLQNENSDVVATAPAVLSKNKTNDQSDQPRDGSDAKAMQVSDGGKIFTLKEAVDYAVANNPSLKQVKETINQADSNVGLLRSYVYPTLSYDFKAGSAQSATLSGNTVLFGGNSYNNYNGDLQLQQPLFVYGSLAAIRSGNLGIKLNQVNVELQERTLKSQVIQAFHSIILYKRLLTFLEETRPVVEKSVQTSEERRRIGRSQLLDVLQAKTQLALLQPQIESARNQFEASGVQLATLMGMTNVPQISVRGRLKTILFKDIKPLLVDKTAYFPEIEQNSLQISQIQENKETEMGKYWPTLKLVGNYFSNAYTQSDIFSSSAQSWNAYVELNIPIFQGFASKFDSAVYVSQEIQLGHARHQLDNTIYSNAVTNKTAVDSAEVSLTSAVEADRLAEASLSEAVRQYRLATIDFLQFLTIEQSALTAKSQVEQLRYNSLVAYTNYFVATGQPLQKLIDYLNTGANP